MYKEKEVDKEENYYVLAYQEPNNPPNYFLVNEKGERTNGFGLSNLEKLATFSENAKIPFERISQIVSDDLMIKVQESLGYSNGIKCPHIKKVKDVEMNFNGTPQTLDFLKGNK